MTQEHPITPPPELVQEWVNGHYGGKVHRDLGGVERTLATQAARWGADQELEACLVEIRDGAGRVYIDETKLRVCLADDIWTARRPHPPSLKEQALGLLNEGPVSDLLDDEVAVIRRALESLPD